LINGKEAETEVTKKKKDEDGNVVRRLPTDEGFGHYEGDYQDDDRSNFLGTNQPSLLYFWYFVDEYELLPTTLNIIGTEQAANSESIPETAGVSPHKKRKKNDKKKREDIFAQSLNNISIAELAHQLTVHEENMVKFQV